MAIRSYMDSAKTKQDIENKSSEQFKQAFGDMSYRVLNQQGIIKSLTEYIQELERDIRKLQEDQKALQYALNPDPDINNDESQTDPA